MKPVWTIVLGALLCVSQFVAAQNLEQQLTKLGFDSIRPFEVSRGNYTEAWELFISQPLNHDQPDGKRFRQRVILRHNDFESPVVFVTEGYAAHYGLSPRYNDELASRLEANLVVAEHRYFGHSLPDSLDWAELNMKNITDDLHNIATRLKQIYRNSWISTGISKGGQTSIYYRYFYPDDVHASVPYVAPLNFSDQDERVYHFLDTVGSDACRQRIFDIQYRLLAEQENFRQMFADSAAARNLTFEMVGGIEKAYEFNVLEFSFAYWQWYPVDCDQLPAADADLSTIYNVFIKAAGYDFFADNSIISYQPFFYQALTEMGMYNYQTTGFEEVLQYVTMPDFRHTLPEGVDATYNPQLNLDVDKWLRKQGNNMLYIYGAYDAWSATAVQPGNKTNAIKLLLPAGSHRTRLRHFSNEIQEEALNTLREWLQLNL
jgi:hypothetical protein